jgi:hypothetical protein
LGDADDGTDEFVCPEPVGTDVGNASSPGVDDPLLLLHPLVAAREADKNAAPINTLVVLTIARPPTEE